MNELYILSFPLQLWTNQQDFVPKVGQLFNLLKYSFTKILIEIFLPCLSFHIWQVKAVYKSMKTNGGDQ